MDMPVLAPSFNTLDNLRTAYYQAITSIKYGKYLSPESRYFFYRDYYIYDMIINYSKITPLDKLYYQKLNLLIEDDNKNSNDNLNLLKIYLENDRNISFTAKKVNLHRNTVIYRLNKMEEMLNLNFSLPEVKLRLLISLKILEIIPYINKLNNNNNGITQ